MNTLDNFAYRSFSEDSSRLKITRRSIIQFLLTSTTVAGLTVNFSHRSLADVNISLEHISKPRILGQADAPIHIIEYYSMTCGHCRDFHNKTFPKVKTNLIDTGKVKFEFSPFPLDGLALRAHAIARALPENKYFGMVTLLMSKQDEWKKAQDPLKSLYRYGQLAGISASDFNNLMQNRPLLEKIVEMRQKSSVAWQIDATPSFVINDEKVISGNKSFEEFKSELADYEI